MPLLAETDEFGGYKVVLESAFSAVLSKAEKSLGALAVIYDKNPMEASGYAAVLAEVSKEDVYLVEYHESDEDPNVKFQDRVLFIRNKKNG